MNNHKIFLKIGHSDNDELFNDVNKIVSDFADSAKKEIDKMYIKKSYSSGAIYVVIYHPNDTKYNDKDSISGLYDELVKVIKNKYSVEEIVKKR